MPSRELWLSAPLPFAHLREQLRVGMATTSRREKIAMLLTLLVLLTSLNCMFLFMNFMCNSVTYGSQGYTTNVVPAFFWVFLYVIPCACYHLYRGWRPSYLTWRTHLGRRILLSLVALGFIDAMGGITATYSAPHTPMFLQTLMGGFGVIWTFGLTRVLVPKDAPGFHVPRLTVWGLVAFLLIIAANAVAAIPQRDSLKQGANIAWIAINASSWVLPVLYNVVQARFMRQVDTFHSEENDEGDNNNNNNSVKANLVEGTVTKDATYDSASIKMTMLSCDASMQMIVLLLCFPLDFLPWFGSSPGDPAASWEGLLHGVQCIFGKCDNALVYTLLYILSFWANHGALALMNHYSTTVTSFALAMGQPINLLLLWWFPSLNVFGMPSPWPYSVTCFLLSFIAAFLFFISDVADKLAASNDLGETMSLQAGVHTQASDTSSS